jgi:glycosyltransferase involved in cell wall biosynthesis
MRTLVIAGEYPWPANSGSRLRLLTTLRGLRRCGPTELFSIVPERREEFDPPDDSVGLARVGRIGFDDRPNAGLRLISTMVRPSKPLGLPLRDRAIVTRAVARFMAGPYDLIWYFGMRPWVLAGELGVAPTILDLDDLEDQKISARLSMPRPTSDALAAKVKQFGARSLSGEEIRRWQRLHRHAESRVSATAVCSQLDAGRARQAGLTRVEVIPNGYQRIGEPVGKAAVGLPPTVVFQGTLRYPPNALAARYLVREVGPALRQLVPDVQIRLVGVGSPSLNDLNDPPRVTLVGQVADIGSELAKADLVVVPVRFGSGTRVKILEAFAQRIPVVSTTLGAEGLDARDGVHLLIGDTVSDMANACARLLSDQELRQELIAEAQHLFLEKFQSDVVEGQVARLAHRVERESMES